MSAAEIRKLKFYLSNITPGRIENSSKLESLLISCWEDLNLPDGNQTSMGADKLQGRMEDLKWNPPTLTFAIERHGSLVQGGSRAEVHWWEVNLKDNSAGIFKESYRQIHSRQKSLNVKPLAENAANLILSNAQHDSLKWLEDDNVRVLTGKIIPNIGPQETVAGRRKRFRKDLLNEIKDKGWVETSPNVFQIVKPERG